MNALHRIPRSSAAQETASISEDFEELTQDPQKSDKRAPHFIRMYLAKLCVQYNYLHLSSPLTPDSLHSQQREPGIWDKIHLTCFSCYFRVTLPETLACLC